MIGASKPAMPELDITTDLRIGADNIHSIGPVQAANLLRAAAETIDKLRHELNTLRRAVQSFDDRVEPVMSPAMRAKVEAWYHDVFGRRGLSQQQDTEVSIADARTMLGIANAPTIAVVGEERGCAPDSACAVSPRCRTRAEMRANHGTPEQFIAAISRAAGEMTVAEADRAVARYCDAWNAATEPDAALQRAINSELLAMHCNSASATQAEFKRALESATKRVEMDVMPAEVARVIGPNEASCIGCEGEQFEGAICDHCGDHIELARNSDGTFRRVYHSPEQILAMNLADPDSPEAVMRRDLEELGATEDGYTNDLRAAVALPRTGFKLTRDPTSYDPDNPCADPTLEPEKT